MNRWKLVLDPDGEWSPKKEQRRYVPWRTYDPDERESVAAGLA